MATQLAQDNEGTHIDGEPGGIDYEAEARAIGWKSLEELGGKVDSARFVDAKTFYERGQELLPVLKANNRDLRRKVESLEKDVKRMAGFVSTAEKRGYEQALSEIRARQEQAVETGDLDAFRKATKDADKLADDMAAAKGEAGGDDDDDPSRRAEEFADWAADNKWYEANHPVVGAYADSIAQSLQKKRGGYLTQADLKELSDKVATKFADRYPDLFGGEEEAPAPRQKKPMVDGGGARQPARGGKTYNDLSHDARQMCDKWVKQGLMTRDDYVKNYQWS